MKFDIGIIPFSYAGSFMAVSYNKANFRSFNNDEGLYLRSILRSAYTPFVARLIPLQGGLETKYNLEAEPSELRINLTESADRISVCFADHSTIVIKGEGKSELLLDFLTAGGSYDYIYEIPMQDGIHYMANCYKNNRKYVISVQKGQACLDQKWQESSSEYSKLIFKPIDGQFQITLLEVETEWDELPRTPEYDNCRMESSEAFDKFYRSMPEVPDKYTEAAEMASYINWSAIVRPNGFLTREGMYMSKNWMCSVWSWDHCFNAMALSYNDPQAAWDQFMIIFDHQDEYGRLPDSINDSHVTWNYSKPPIHGWALSRMMENMELSYEQRQEAYQKLSAWTNWWFNYRDHDHDGICEYCHGNDSGWDNSTAFAVVPPVELPELQAYLIVQMDLLVKLADSLGMSEEAAKWQKKADNTLQAMLEHCFENGLPKAVRSGTHEVIPNNSLILYEAIILGDRLPVSVRAQMIAVLQSDKFLTDHGYATESPASADYVSDGYWRGPIWAPSTMILLDGLYQCGEVKLVRETVEKFSDMISASGCAENFDALTGEGLRDRAYTWTSSAFLVMAHRYLR